MTCFYNITYLFNDDYQTKTSIYIKNNTKVKRILQKCGIRPGQVHVYLKVDKVWEHQKPNNKVVYG